jgi:hypothetical protein
MYKRLLRWIFITLPCLLPALPAFAQADMLNIRDSRIVNAPNVADWPITTALTAVSFDGAVTRVDFTRKDGPNRWPDVTPTGWTGPLQYTLWLFVKNGNQWVGSGFIQFWHGRDGSGNAADPDVPSVYNKHWYYAERWSPIFGHGPIAPGEEIGFMVTSGNQRDSAGPDSVHERSNVVTFAATDNGHYSFSTTPTPVPVPTPVPAPTPAPVPVPTPLPSTDLSSVLTMQAVNHASEMAQLQELQTQLALVRQDIADFRAAVKSKWVAIMDSPIVKYGLAALTGFFLTHKWGG